MHMDKGEGEEGIEGKEDVTAATTGGIEAREWPSGTGVDLECPVGAAAGLERSMRMVVGRECTYGTRSRVVLRDDC